MSKIHKTLFLSDIHLSESEPVIARHFCSFLMETSSEIDAIYILGDLFDAWIGDDHLTPFHQTIIDVMKAVSNRGIVIHYLHGNRDFLIGEHFLKRCGATRIHDGAVISLYGEPVLLMHGDLLCTKDTGYQYMRRLFQLKGLQAFFLRLPLSFRKFIAANLRKTSQHVTQRADLERLDAVQAEIEKRLLQTPARLLIHGHTHRTARHSFIINQVSYERIVLPAWEDQPRVFAVYADGRKEWLDIAHH